MDKKYIIDVDTGIDDALALVFASRTIKNKVIGITTCGGNVKLEDAVTNSLKILSLSDWNVPVFPGASKSIEGNEFVHAYEYHGTNGICDIQVETSNKAETIKAEDFMISAAEKEKNLAIICLATPTNLARAILKSPKISKKIQHVYIMGGAVNVPGNQTEYAEYTFFQDPKAVQIVLENIKDVYIIPLDVTNQCVITDKEASLMKAKSRTGIFMKEAIINWYRFFGYPKKRQFELYDPLALSAASQKFIDFSDVKVGITTQGLKEGEIFINGKYPVKIAQTVRAREFIDFFFEVLG